MSSFLRQSLEAISAAPESVGLEVAHPDDLGFFVPETLIKEFADWKSRGRAGEDDHYYFGKDGAYDKPRTSTGGYALQHVHIVPLSDPAGLADWNRKWAKSHGRRSSDTALVYVDGGRHGYLLLTILWHPDAHAIAEMRTPEDKEMMEGLAAVAEQFIHDGSFDI